MYRAACCRCSVHSMSHIQSKFGVSHPLATSLYVGVMEKALGDWTEDDVRTLVATGRVEGPTLEYKSAIYKSNDRGNREFLLDICSMANANGGLIVIGVSELRDDSGPTGAPDPNAVLGIAIDNAEQVLAAFEGRILDCVDQRLAVESHAVRLTDGRVILLFRVPNSLSKPHRAYYQGKPNFPARRERQRYELSASEIKDLVMRTASQLSVVEESVQSATWFGAVGARDEGPLLNIAIRPVFAGNFSVDLRSEAIRNAFSAFDVTGMGRRTFAQASFSAHGITRQVNPHSTLTLAHNGLLKLSMQLHSALANDGLRFAALSADLYIRGLALGSSSLFQLAGLSGPAVLGASMAIAQGAVAVYEDHFDEVAIPAGVHNFPTVLLDALSDAIGERVRPLCDLIHQSFGRPESPAFSP